MSTIKKYIKTWQSNSGKTQFSETVLSDEKHTLVISDRIEIPANLARKLPGQITMKRNELTISQEEIDQFKAYKLELLRKEEASNKAILDSKSNLINYIESIKNTIFINGYTFGDIAAKMNRFPRGIIFQNNVATVIYFLEAAGEIELESCENDDLAYLEYDTIKNGLVAKVVNPMEELFYTPEPEQYLILINGVLTYRIHFPDIKPPENCIGREKIEYGWLYGLHFKVEKII